MSGIFKVKVAVTTDGQIIIGARNIDKYDSRDIAFTDHRYPSQFWYMRVAVDSLGNYRLTTKTDATNNGWILI